MDQRAPANLNELQCRAVDRVLAAALDESDSTSRRRVIRELSGGDERVMDEVEALLVEADQLDDSTFMQEPPQLASRFLPDTAEGVTSAVGHLSAMPGRIGRYRIIRVIASGGMGTVYLAEQDRPRRLVAVKIMRHGIVSPSLMRRFEYEAQILARLRHPNIAQIFEAGTHDDPGGSMPFFAMEYVAGAQPIVEYAEGRQLDLHERLQLFLKVCAAVHHGHQKGVIHRDLKPANILVDTSGEPKIIDFGVARVTDADIAVTTVQTGVGQLVGTLQYMSPEQCEADVQDLDTRSDVYSLGAVLYELLTGSLPYDLSGIRVYEATRVIRTTQPRRLSAITPQLRGDVETIVLKALEKDRTRRYQSAQQFADDINAFRDRRPISARPPSVAYLSMMFARRNWWLVAGSAAVLTALVLALVGVGWGMIHAQRARVEAVAQAERATRVSDFLTSLLSIPNPYEYPGGPEVQVAELLDEASRRIEQEFRDDPLIESELRHTLSITYRNIGRFQDAEEQMLIAMSLTMDAEDAGATRLDELRASLGALLCDMRRFDESESLLRESLQSLKQRRGEDDPSTMYASNALGWTLYSAGHPIDAEPYFVDTLARRRRVLGETSLETLKTMTNLALVRIETGDLAAAEAPAHNAAATLQERYGDAHPDTIYSTHIWALWQWRSKRLEDALSTYQTVINNARETFGRIHPWTLYWEINVAFLLGQTDNVAQALKWCDELLPRLEQVYGVEHGSTQQIVQLRDRLLAGDSGDE